MKSLSKIEKLKSNNLHSEWGRHQLVHVRGTIQLRLLLMLGPLEQVEKAFFPIFLAVISFELDLGARNYREGLVCLRLNGPYASQMLGWYWLVKWWLINTLQCFRGSPVALLGQTVIEDAHVEHLSHFDLHVALMQAFVWFVWQHTLWPDWIIKRARNASYFLWLVNWLCYWSEECAFVTLILPKSTLGRSFLLSTRLFAHFLFLI